MLIKAFRRCPVLTSIFIAGSIFVTTMVFIAAMRTSTERRENLQAPCVNEISLSTPYVRDCEFGPCQFRTIYEYQADVIKMRQTLDL